MKKKKQISKKNLLSYSYHKIILILTILIIFLLFILGNIIYNFEENKLDKKNIISNSEENFEIKKLNSSSKLREYYLTAKEENNLLYENHSTKMFLYNSKLPGPIIRAKVGDTVRVYLKNKLPEETTIHWHGMQVENLMDGVPGITQDPIKSGENYIYEFEVKNPGIYWYHPHYNTAHQIEMGLYGALIVDDEEDIIETDKDIVLMLDDIRLDKNYQISQNLYGMDIMHGRYGNLFLINGKPQFNFEAKKGDLIRLRLINPSNARTYNFGIKNHELLVIGKDIGLLEKPYTTNIISIAPGERYDVLIYIKDLGDLEYFTKYYKDSYNLGEIKVTKTNPNDKKGYYESIKSQILNSKIPDWSFLENKTSNFTLELYAKGGMMGNFQWTINGKSSNLESEKINLEKGNLYKVTLKNLQMQVHPMHLHGQKFQVLSRNGNKIKEKGWKDTVFVNGGETVDIAFIAEGEGTWVNHCHILEHAEAGMLMEYNIS
jgi:FtsP/CotA-like multicopper oxidase with cupredoxin domain